MAYAIFEAGPNRVVISETWKNLAMASKQTITPAGSGVLKTWSLTVAGTNPVLAFLGESNAALATRTQSGNSFTFTGFTTSGSFTAYVFDEPNFGRRDYLVITNPDTNEVHFDATLKYMKVRGLLQGNANQGGSITLPAGRTYAALAGSAGNIMLAVGGVVGGGPQWLISVVWRKGVVNINGNVASISAIDTGNFSQTGANGTPFPAPGQYGQPWVRAPILDVTGY
ncbi:hypothetical protein [Xanthomonas vesicatoria]|uniref:Uncharacterized protein n=1 Tax=Xanthomonas vesicatoria ATCC 35937 TaxID=925775 RepID=F0BAN6_9XANT|nr:hypothetical protein [Xanthomonas vesicatoria]APP76877.1 hypothetical protein BJD12_18445 [Xanthomonas vesicatoria ATCC 35937]EGD10494.1 hypothetical protein XVE_1153 [Xanthomonas vesicatoria ATCC 35937]KTF30734.1 hypothetical protein LMG920_18515 [Xanthomonas vesicatoria]KTF33985.1 hypothetical protein LMG919_15635 [Xanthomonas vesicatoria]MCC8559285.1 hypothetical protein [Xanthomonas vesicatoria]